MIKYRDEDPEPEPSKEMTLRDAVKTAVVGAIALTATSSIALPKPNPDNITFRQLKLRSDLEGFKKACVTKMQVDGVDYLLSVALTADFLLPYKNDLGETVYEINLYGDRIKMIAKGHPANLNIGPKSKGATVKRFESDVMSQDVVTIEQFKFFILKCKEEFEQHVKEFNRQNERLQ